MSKITRKIESKFPNHFNACLSVHVSTNNHQLSDHKTETTPRESIIPTNLISFYNCSKTVDLISTVVTNE